ncbi:MAG: hypothetical protein K2W82_07555 [Candidatus Obscuribacterales bacterium]|nr:hypothetical protein [Candidatus Obscuribacterales bacterium]
MADRINEAVENNNAQENSAKWEEISTDNQVSTTKSDTNVDAYKEEVSDVEMKYINGRYPEVYKDAEKIAGELNTLGRDGLTKNEQESIQKIFDKHTKTIESTELVRGVNGFLQRQEANKNGEVMALTSDENNPPALTHEQQKYNLTMVPKAAFENAKPTSEKTPAKYVNVEGKPASFTANSGGIPDIFGNSGMSFQNERPPMTLPFPVPLPRSY